MSTIAQLPAPVLTQAHRDAMAYIQDLAITITQQGIYAVSAEYIGHIHSFRADVLLFSEIEKGNWKANQNLQTILPGRTSFAGHEALEQLQATARELEALLTPPTGDAA